MAILDAAGQDLIFRTARTRKGWSPEPVTDAQIGEIYDLMKFGPTSLNGSPGRKGGLTTTCSVGVEREMTVVLSQLIVTDVAVWP